jgi:hypothetical protein
VAVGNGGPCHDLRFIGRLGGRGLSPGRYQFAATPTANGKTGQVRSTGLRIKRR